MSTVCCVLRYALRANATYALRPPRRAEHRLFGRDRRQLPGAGAGRADVGVDVHVDQRRLAGGDGLRQHAGEILRAGDGVARDAGGLGPGGEVRVVGPAVGALVEAGAVLAPVEIGVLQVADRGPGEVVPHHPDHGDVVLHRGAQHVRHHGEAAVAADRNAGPVGRGELGAQDRAGAEAHAGVAPGVEHGLRPARLPELHEPVVVDAGVQRDDGVVGQHRAAVGDDALRPDRRAVRLEARLDEGRPLLAPARRWRRPRRRGAARCPPCGDRARRAAARRNALASARMPRSGG